MKAMRISPGVSVRPSKGVLRVYVNVYRQLVHQPGTAVPGLDISFAAIWTGCFFPHLLAVPLDFLIERLWTQDY